jgi:hypothetical protein
MRRRLRHLQTYSERAIALMVFAFFLTGNTQVPGAPDVLLDQIVGSDRFDFIGWEIEALSEKGAQAAVPVEAYLDDRQRAQFVVDYLELSRRLREVEREVDRIYADPSVGNPDLTSMDWRVERDRLRAQTEQRRPIAEAIIQDQIAHVLADEGLAAGGRVFPPVLARVTPLPHILIVSPRDRIKREPGVTLSAGITVDRSNVIEDAVFARLGKSALVTPIGGLAVYPAMIIETADLLSLLQVVSHEWVHHWLFFRPLGIELLSNAVSGGDALTINETVASLVGDEIGIAVLKRFYPEIAKRDYPFVYDPPGSIEDLDAPVDEADAEAFSFNREMYATRVQVDEYLAEAHALNVKADEAESAGRNEEAQLLRSEALAWIVKAEAYMENRRKVFVDNGYRWIRKINQAYFAFYGSYADRPGASGADPIGPAVRELRARIPRVSDFLEAVASVRAFDDLQRVLAQYP